MQIVNGLYINTQVCFKHIVMSMMEAINIKKEVSLCHRTQFIIFQSHTPTLFCYKDHGCPKPQVFECSICLINDRGLNKQNIFFRLHNNKIMLLSVSSNTYQLEKIVFNVYARTHSHTHTHARTNFYVPTRKHTLSHT